MTAILGAKGARAVFFQAPRAADGMERRGVAVGRQRQESRPGVVEKSHQIGVVVAAADFSRPPQAIRCSVPKGGTMRKGGGAEAACPQLVRNELISWRKVPIAIRAREFAAGSKRARETV